MVTKYMQLRYVALSKTLLLVIVWSHLVETQSNGDVRMIQDLNATYWGRLEVYLDGEWGTFCADGFNSHAADAACRQLGYAYSVGEVYKARDYSRFIPLASNSTPIHTGYSKCGNTDDGGFSHVLRCFQLYVDPIYSTCTHDDDVITQCSVSQLTDNGYDTELFLNSAALNSTYKSSGVLEIFSSSKDNVNTFLGSWSNICGTKFDQNAANTACIQLGYTGALSYTTSANRSRDTDIWLDGVTCGDNAYSCLDSCFCYPRTLTAVQCDPGNVVALTCTFDLAKWNAVYPGTRMWCEEQEKTFCAPDNIENPIKLIIVSTVLSATIVILSVVIVGLMMVMWNRQERTHYQTIN